MEVSHVSSKVSCYMELKLYQIVPHVVKKAVHGKRGMHGAFVKVTLKNIFTQASFEKAFNPDEDLEVVELTKEPATYSWEDTFSNELVFMNPKTFEEIRIPKADCDKAEFLYEGMEVSVNKQDNTVLGIQLPTTAVYTVVSLNEANMSGGSYVATINSGAKVSVPLNVKVGLKIKVSTEDGTFVGRAT